MSQRKGELLLAPNDQPVTTADVSRRKQQLQQPRQLLSCTKCRERKVKCDRTKPCSACCARGAPKECHFIAEGGDYAPIQQSYELRKLRAENLRLKDRLRACQVSIEDEDSDFAASPESQLGEKPGSSQKRRPAKQKRFQGTDWQDSIYFGSPSLSSVMSDFASTNVDAAVTLAHVMPRGPELHAPRTPRTYPFATLFKANPDECIPELLSCLPLEEGELAGYLNYFDDRVNLCSFPQLAVEINRAEIERYLSDARRNAQMCPDMLALIFAAIALGAQHSVWEKSGQRWNSEVMKKETGKGDVYIAAAMQALRLASFLHKPTLLGIQTLIMIGPYLTNSGRFLDSWTLFGTTIRLAHSVGLHRHPKHLNPVPPTQKECSIRQRLWWWMLHMDEQYSMTLGRPLGISGIGDCSWPQELTTDPIMLRFGEFKNRFTIVARRILSSEKLTNARIDEFTDELRTLLDTMPETLQYQESWNQSETDAPEWPLRATAATTMGFPTFFGKRTATYTKTVYYCKTHTYLILLNRQRIEKHSVFALGPPNHDTALSFRAINKTPNSQPSPSMSAQAPVRGRSLVLSSSVEVITAFMFFYFREPAALIDWTLSQQAFNGCMLLLYDAIEARRITIGARKVEQVFVVFQELQDNGVHELAGQAVERISWGLAELHKVVASSSMGGNTAPSSQPPLHNATREAKQSEATYYSDSMDAVMESTGMVLLEDPGLQSYVHEAYAPVTWASSSSSSEPTDPFLPERGNQSPKAVKEKTTASSSEFRLVRSPGAMQSKRRSTAARLARGACMPSSLGKTPCYTAPASAIVAHQTAYESDSSHLLPLKQHQRHLSREQRPGNLILQLDAQRHGIRSSTVDQQQQQQHQQQQQQQQQQQPSFQHIQLRHHSCPTTANQAAPKPPLMRPTYSSPTAVYHPNPTPSSSYRTATTTPALVPDPSTTTTSNSNTTTSSSNSSNPLPGPFEDTPRQMGYAFATTHGSSAAAAAAAVVAARSSLAPLSEHLSMEDLRHFAGSAGAG